MTLVHRHLWMKLLHPVARSFCLPYRPGRREHLGRQGPREQPEPPDLPELRELQARQVPREPWEPPDRPELPETTEQPVQRVPLVQQELLDLLGPPDLPGLMEIRGPQDL